MSNAAAIATHILPRMTHLEPCADNVALQYYKVLQTRGIGLFMMYGGMPQVEGQIKTKKLAADNNEHVRTGQLLSGGVHNQALTCPVDIITHAKHALWGSLTNLQTLQLVCLSHLE